jgi:hypothetical protein
MLGGELDPLDIAAMGFISCDPAQIAAMGLLIEIIGDETVVVDSDAAVDVPRGTGFASIRRLKSIVNKHKRKLNKDKKVVRVITFKVTIDGETNVVKKTIEDPTIDLKMIEIKPIINQEKKPDITLQLKEVSLSQKDEHLDVTVDDLSVHANTPEVSLVDLIKKNVNNYVNNS